MLLLCAQFFPDRPPVVSIKQFVCEEDDDSACTDVGLEATHFIRAIIACLDVIHKLDLEPESDPQPGSITAPVSPLPPTSSNDAPDITSDVDPFGPNSPLRQFNRLYGAAEALRIAQVVLVSASIPSVYPSNCSFTHPPPASNL